MFESDESELNQHWDEIASYLGNVMIEWSRLEFLVSMVFLHVSRVPENVAALLARKLRGDGLDDLTRKLLSVLPPPESEPIRAWLDSVRALRQRRNSLLHGHLVNRSEDGAWYPTNLQWVYNARTGAATLDGSRLSSEQLSSLIDEIHAALAEFQKLPASVRNWTTAQ